MILRFLAPVYLIGFIILSGCTTYSPTTSGPYAQLGVKDFNLLRNETLVAVAPNPNECKGWKFMPLSKRFGQPTNIDSNRLITILALHIVQYNRIMFVATFYPKPNNLYLIQTESESSPGMLGSLKTHFSILNRQKKVKNGKVITKDKKIPFIKRDYRVTNNFLGTASCFDKIIRDSKKVYSMSKSYWTPLVPYLLQKKIDHTEITQGQVSTIDFKSSSVV